jgi:DeoR/GlpR family transcriptional regulator of sugar metabolism
MVSKFRVTAIEKLDAVVTDEQLHRETQENIRDLGVAVHVGHLSKGSFLYAPP